jgi:hypothetical protein
MKRMAAQVVEFRMKTSGRSIFFDCEFLYVQK